jgi:uncharacterized membrane protein YccC
MIPDELPLPEPISRDDTEHGVDYYTATTLAKFAHSYYTHRMRKLREAQGLSDERIREVADELYGVTHFCHTFAHAIADPLLAKIAELEAEVAQIEKWHDEVVDNRLKVCVERDALRTQLAEAQKDAKRYRWLRDDAWDAGVRITDGNNPFDDARLDKLVDAALTPKES